MSMGDLSIFCCLLQFLSSIVYSLLCKDLSHLLLSLFLGILFFWGYCKWNYFLIFFHNLFLLVYRKAIEFCRLIFYLTTLLKLFMVPRSFLVEFFISFRYKIMSSANRDRMFDYFLSKLYSFYFFFLSYCAG
jgi:hypothetical protein